MNKVREELDGIAMKAYRVKDISELLGDYFFNNITGREHTKGDTLVTILIEKVKELDESISELYVKTREFEANNQ